MGIASRPIPKREFVQHEAIHHGQWSVDAKLAGLDAAQLANVMRRLKIDMNDPATNKRTGLILDERAPISTINRSSFIARVVVALSPH